MRSSAIYTNTERDNGSRPSASASAQNKQLITINVGSSASNSHELLTIEVKRTFEDDQCEFTAYIVDDNGKKFEIAWAGFKDNNGRAGKLVNKGRHETAPENETKQGLKHHEMNSRITNHIKK